MQIENVIVPLLPLFISDICKYVFSGKVFSIPFLFYQYYRGDFRITFYYCFPNIIAGLITKKNPFKDINDDVFAYFTALENTPGL
jgi:hypothetical protein